MPGTCMPMRPTSPITQLLLLQMLAYAYRFRVTIARCPAIPTPVDGRDAAPCAALPEAPYPVRRDQPEPDVGPRRPSLRGTRQPVLPAASGRRLCTPADDVRGRRSPA